MLEPSLIAQLAAELDRSEQTRVQVEHFSKRYPGMTVEDGYAISREWVRMKLAPIEQIAAEMGDLGEFKRPPDVKDPFSKLSKKPVEPETSESEDANQESGATQTEAKPSAPSEPTPPNSADTRSGTA